jgi:hypothetical protein
MKSRGILVNKEQLKSNYKLTFENNDEKKLYLILHETKRQIFNYLKIGLNYSFSAHKGRKYYFINPQSIKAILPVQRKQEQDLKDFYYDQLLGELGIKLLNQKSIDDKINSLKSFKEFKKLKDTEHLLVLMKSFFTSFYFKHRILSAELDGKEKKTSDLEKEFLLDIETMLFFDKLYNK